MQLINQKDQIQLGSINTSRTELIDLIKAWFAISLAFAILLGGSLFSFNIIPTQINDQFQAEKMSAQESKKVIEHINSISEKLNNLDGIEFKEIDEILRLNKIEKMRTINLTFVIRNIYKLRIRHLKLFILWVYANLLSDKST